MKKRLNSFNFLKDMLLHRFVYNHKRKNNTLNAIMKVYEHA